MDGQGRTPCMRDSGVPCFNIPLRLDGFDESLSGGRKEEVEEDGFIVNK
jgi:hypothetical protein